MQTSKERLRERPLCLSEEMLLGLHFAHRYSYSANDTIGCD